MSITHHLDDATLMSFAAGALPGALAAVAAAHVAMCPRCRRELATLERIGGALVADLAPVDLGHAAPSLPGPASAERGPGANARAGVGELPWPIAGMVAGGLDAVRWRRLGIGVWDHVLPIAGAGKLRLLKVSPLRNVPEHGHGGAELTLVLRGSFYDATGRYAPGDVADLDADVAHQPVTDKEGDCICVVASETPEEFRSVLARQWQRWRGF